MPNSHLGRRVQPLVFLPPGLLCRLHLPPAAPDNMMSYFWCISFIQELFTAAWLADQCLGMAAARAAAVAVRLRRKRRKPVQSTPLTQSSKNFVRWHVDRSDAVLMRKFAVPAGSVSRYRPRCHLVHVPGKYVCSLAFQSFLSLVVTQHHTHVKVRSMPT
jgi:hypothetical protein